MILTPLLQFLAPAELLENTAAATAQIGMPRGAFPAVIAKLAAVENGTENNAEDSGENSADNNDENNADLPLQVVITPAEYEAEELKTALSAYLPPAAIDIFPAWETLPHERLSPRADTVARRLRLLRRLAHPEEFPPLRVLIMPVRALLQPIAAGLGQMRPLRLKIGDYCDLGQLQEDLVNAAYTHVDMVEERGQFAVRGGIIDIFPPAEAHPLRIDFFGDEVEDIRSFSISDQRSLEQVAELYAPPCREILLTDEVRSRAAQAMEKLPGAVDMLDKIASGIAVEGMESLLAVLTDKLISVVAELPADSRILVLEPERTAAHAQSLLDTTAEFLTAAWAAAAAGGELPIEVDNASFWTLEKVQELAQQHNLAWWELGGLAGETLNQMALREVKNFSGKVEAAFQELREKTRAQWQIVLSVESKGLGKRLFEQLAEAEIPARLVKDLGEITPGIVHIVLAPGHTGWVAETNRFALITGDDLVSRFRDRKTGRRALPARRKKSVDPLALHPGDYVVHEYHGVGQFQKLVKRAIGGDGPLREYVVLEYAASTRGGPRDQLWVPTNQLDLVSKYTGGEKPKLSKMGGTDWKKTKARAKAAVREIAKELIRLYAQRRATRGYAFSPDTPWQQELEEAFEFVETADQLQAIEEVKRDMESPEPMDRLISGDVGYGKTEIAVRAAFKAVQDGKQVAVLVPTTLLVQQHLETFRERYAGFPLRVEALSRFQSEKESAEIKAGLHSGKVDVVIGTHKLLTGDVRFKDLGLVVIDEEQRFGVEHKETLQQLYPAVDVLAMSATPIPRTLEMAVTGIRQMSTLATPPEERHPILTYVGVQDFKQIKAAIRRELLRSGQVFYIHNRVQSINKTASKLAELIPEARIGVAHGKMSEYQLEEVIQKFWYKEIDVLVCTTIVETGLDISNANTLIVENAHKFGLSQLHQLRGRVGRGRERAYAYFLYPPDTSLTETSLERLRTIATHTELGAGFQVALKDLEIRGAGNLLGGQQSGHIAGVGFDLYIRLVSEAVAQLTGQKKAAAAERDIRIELPVEAYVPESWVAAERLRLEIYSKIAHTDSAPARENVREELEDRYGALPLAVQRLFSLVELRELAKEAGVEEIALRGNNLRFAPVVLSDFRQARLKRLYPKAIVKTAVRVVLVPLPEVRELDAEPHLFENEEIMDYAAQFLHAILIAE